MDLDPHRFFTGLHVGVGLAIAAIVALTIREIASGYRPMRLTGACLTVLGAETVWFWVIAVEGEGMALFLPLSAVLLAAGVYWLLRDRKSNAR